LRLQIPHADHLCLGGACSLGSASADSGIKAVRVNKAYPCEERIEVDCKHAALEPEKDVPTVKSSRKKGNLLPGLRKNKQKLQLVSATVEWDGTAKQAYATAAAEPVACRLPIVSMASSNHFRQLLGSIGSIQQNAAHRDIAVFDLGLKADQVRKLSNISRVTVVAFPWDEYPAHVRLDERSVRRHQNYAFQLLQKERALQMLARGELLPLSKLSCHDSVLFLDASIEVQPVGLAEIDRIVAQQGYFLTLQPPPLFEWTPDAYFGVYHASKRTIRDRISKQLGWNVTNALRQVSGGINAVRLGSAFLQKVLGPAAVCARRLACMVPNVTVTKEKNCCFSQGLLSAGAYALGMKINGETRFWQNSRNASAPVPTGTVLVTMRGNYAPRWRPT